MKPLNLYHVEVYFWHKCTGYTQFDALENAVYDVSQLASASMAGTIDITEAHEGLLATLDDGQYKVYLCVTASFYVGAKKSKQVKDIAVAVMRDKAKSQDVDIEIDYCEYDRVTAIDDVDTAWVNAIPFSRDDELCLTCKDILRATPV